MKVTSTRTRQPKVGDCLLQGFSYLLIVLVLVYSLVDTATGTRTR